MTDLTPADEKTIDTLLRTGLTVGGILNHTSVVEKALACAYQSDALANQIASLVSECIKEPRNFDTVEALIKFLSRCKIISGSALADALLAAKECIKKADRTIER